MIDNGEAHEIRVVGVCSESQRGVRGIAFSQIGRKIPEFTI